MDRITLDFETRSGVDLTKSNPWTYAEDLSTGVICAAWKHSEDKQCGTWTYLDDSALYPLVYWVRHTDLPIFAFNAAFEIAIWENIMVPRHGWPPIARDRWRDTQALANYLALPPSLDALCKAVGLPGKDPEGKRLISKYSKLHLKTAKHDIPPEDLRAFVEYCVRDVEQEEAVDERMGELPDSEQSLFLEDLEINLRGLALDVPGLTSAHEVVKARRAELANAFRAATGLSPTQRGKFQEWLREADVEVDNMQSAYLTQYLEDENVCPDIEEAMRLYAAYNKASVSKLDAMLRNVDSTGRARFQTRYHGANTGRNTGAGIQPLNLPRTYEDYEPDMVVRDIDMRDPEYLDVVYGDAVDCVSKALRHYIVAAPGHRFVVADFVSIEAVILAVLADETWKVEAFHNREPIYERTADIVFGLPPGTVTKYTHPSERHVGKICELASGYQGSVGAWRKFDTSDRFTDEEVRGIVKKWRLGHPAIVCLWSDLDATAKHVVRHGGAMRVGELVLGMAGSFMYMEAPNGKRIWYAQPELALAMPAWHNTKEEEDCAAGVCSCKPSMQVRYMSWKAGQWRPTFTYGGKLTENACQFVSRELLRVAQTRVMRAGYPVVLTVYDEMVAECPDGFGSVEDMVRLMEMPVSWAEDWPYRADGWEGTRYKK